MAWTYSFFAIGIILTICLLVARIKKLGWIAKQSGRLLILCSGISMIGAGFWYGSGFKTGDICE